MMSATVPAWSLMLMITPVSVPGAGEIVPVITIDVRPEYEDASVWRVIEYVAPCAGTKAWDEMKTSAKRPERRSAEIRDMPTLS